MTKTKINPDSIYPIKAVVELGVLPKENTPQSNWEVMLRHIREGKVTAQNVGSAERPRYIILGKDLIEYLKSRNLYPKDEQE